MAVETITQRPSPLQLTIRPEPGWGKGVPSAIDSGLSYTPSRAMRKPEVAEAEGLSSWDLLDLINPLQHLPFVSSLYREVTGDTIRPEIKIAGGAALGGVFGMVSNLADVVFEQATGKGVSSAIIAALVGEDPAPAQLASAGAGAAPHAGDLPALAPAPNQTATLTSPLATPTHANLATLSAMDSQILELYGHSSPKAAAKAYEQTSMMAYLAAAR
jgi:hypothetical protein